ncbi:MAG: alpha/beta hydrolase [Actinomycetota bacterium]|nr:alpha/beta hydrolase [Actinomycetota bacterium]MDA3013147.1 alpha/beta hydrolase [Actinomycetota bacterium]
MPFKLLEDKKTFAYVNSDFPKVCFLHGWGRDSSDFNLIANEFDSFVFDLPGFGKSSKPEISMSPKEYAQYLDKLIPPSIEVIVGHSFGGRVAVYLSEFRNFKKLILIGVPLIRLNLHKNNFSILKFFKILNKYGLISQNLLENIKKKLGSTDYQNVTGIMRETLVKAVNDNLETTLSHLSIKTELIWGEFDTEVPVEVAIEANKIIKNSNLHILENESHNPLISSYSKIINIIN